MKKMKEEKKRKKKRIKENNIYGKVIENRRRIFV